MRVIGIARAALGTAAAGGCGDDESGEVPKLRLPLARREFLKGSGVLFGTLAAGSVLAALAPSTVWAVELKTLSEAEGSALMALGRVLYPHEKLPDAVYALLAKDLDAKAAGSPVMTKLLKSGIAELDLAAGGNFRQAPAERKFDLVKSIDGTPFFNLVRGQCVTSIYDNDMAFAALGYPGASWDKGGYITRGFQDLSWLPVPPLEASPPPYMG